jgi:hypothetical protein
MISGSAIPVYRHTQVGYATLVVLAVVATVVAFALIVGPSGARTTRMAVGASTGVVLILCAVTFASLTVQVDDRALTWAFGPGVFRQQVRLAEIAEAHVVRGQFLYGFGLRRFAGGWLYNVSGGSAVEIRTTTGRRVRIGTDDPEGLVAAISAGAKIPRP